MNRAIHAVTGSIAALALGASSATALPAVQINYTIDSVANIKALGFLDLTVTSFAGNLLFNWEDTDNNGSYDKGTLQGSEILVQGTVNSLTPGLLSLTLTPTGLDLIQYPNGTNYTYTDTSVSPPVPVNTTAVDPVGILSGTAFSFLAGSKLGVFGPAGAGILSCAGSLCGALPATPIDLSGPLTPINVGGTAVLLNVTDPAAANPSLTGKFSFALGTTAISFDITQATGTVVPEPGTILLVISGLGGLALVGRRRDA